MLSDNLLQIPRIMIAGTHSGVGKTTIATGIMAALADKGLPIQAYKVGPDYIDPSYHTLATGRPSRNLDRWLLGDNLREVFTRSSTDSWAIMEGVMGLFDGVSGTQGYGSSADIAKLLDTPVLLVVDAGNMSRSVAAVVHGFATFDPDLNIAGVILNRVKSSAQETLLRKALEEIKMPVLGVLPREAAICLPERHLGLVPSQENTFPKSFFTELISVISRYIDLGKIQEIMSDTGTQAEKEPCDRIRVAETPSEVIKANIHVERRPIRLGIAKDEAFSFYYQDALDYAENVGFTLVPFSPLHDLELPRDLQGLFLGGGFPEMHLPKLHNNQSLLEAIREFATSGKTIYAECGGYMYLGQQITDFTGEAYTMAGLIPIQAKMTPKLQGMGYRRGLFRRGSFLGDQGTEVYGHEFHYSAVEFRDPDDLRESAAYELYKGEQALGLEGYAQDNIFSSYLHLNFAGHPQLMERWAEYIREGG